MSAAGKPPIDREAIRAMVRQVLRDALPEAVRERIASEAAKAAVSVLPAQKKGEPGSHSADSETSKVEEVAITTDAELAAFVRRVLALAQDAKRREALESGRLKFRLKRARKSPEGDAAPRGGSERIDKGIVTEKKVMAAAKTGKKLVVGKGVVLTPLARDKARQLGVQIERE
jgi:hypothetical protein